MVVWVSGDTLQARRLEMAEVVAATAEGSERGGETCQASENQKLTQA